MANITYQAKNHMPSLISSYWTLNNAVQNSDGTITISPEGGILCLIDTVTDKQYRYYKTTLDIEGAGLNNESNFNNKVSFLIRHIYYNDNHEIAIAKDDFHGVNTFEPVVGYENRYIDVNEQDNRSETVAQILVFIGNGTDSDIIIHSLKLQISQDVNVTQAGEMINDSITSNTASKLEIHLSNATGGVAGFSVYLSGEIKQYLFRFLNNKLITVLTNFGYTLDVGYTVIDNSENELTE